MGVHETVFKVAFPTNFVILIEVHLIALQNAEYIRENSAGHAKKTVDSESVMCYVFNQVVKMQKSGENYAGTCG